jgi:hypothetical protein
MRALATAGGRTFEPAAVRGDAGSDGAVADTRWIDRRGLLKQRDLSTKGSARRRNVAKVAEMAGNFGGAGTDLRSLGGPDENLFRNVASEMGVLLSPCLKSKRFVLT